MVELVRSPCESDWILVRKCALVTVGKASETEPSMEWKKKILAARHSPIRELRFVFRLTDVPYWVAMHLVRHNVGCQPYVRSQRNDRQSDYDRESARQDEPVSMMWSMNAEALMNIANKRLCSKASEETRAVVQEMCDIVTDRFPEFFGLLVPMCQYGRCHELGGCWRKT